MHLPRADAFLTVIALSTAFLTEILVFVALGLEVPQWWNLIEAM